MKRIGAFIKKLFIPGGRLRPCILPAVLLVLAAGMMGWGGVCLHNAFAAFEYNQVEISEEPEDLGIEEVQMDLPEGITNIALFGIDARNDEFKGLSDSIMIITIDAEHNAIKLTSILRDSLVEVEGHGYQKINAAYSLGGAPLAIKTLNQTYDLNIRDYATVDFVSMADIIDFVGGVEVELTSAEVRNANLQIRSMHAERGTALDLLEESGVQTLNGIQAVAFARIRKTATINGTVDDNGRTERQRLVMQQLFEKALSTDITKYPAMIRALLPCMETSLTYGEIFQLAGILTQADLTFEEGRIPTNRSIIVYGLNVKGLGSCVYYNLDYAAAMLNAFIYEDISFDDYMEENGVNLTPWFNGEVVVSNQADSTETEEVTDEAVSAVPEEDTAAETETPDSDTAESTVTEETPATEEDAADVTETPVSDTAESTVTEESPADESEATAVQPETAVSSEQTAVSVQPAE